MEFYRSLFLLIYQCVLGDLYCYLEMFSDWVTLITDEEMKDELAGTTALVLLIKNNTLYCVSSWNFV